ncbi:TUBGCP3 [Bugula neritina]|uniref:TUBGCP3 n=1 Tax=Bugula neritina TaxID=10212 RepID=A0A7J7K9R9_BUGNE|nr:TUBGCP3 [Bugula neritina]
MSEEDQLLRNLTQSSLGKGHDNKQVNDLQRLYRKILHASHFSSDFNVNKVVKHLAVNKDVKVAAEFQTLYEKLAKLGTITHLDNVVEFLHKVGIDNERTQTFNSGVRVSSTPLQSELRSLQTPAALSHFSVTPYGQTPANSVTRLSAGERQRLTMSSSGLGTSRASSHVPPLTSQSQPPSHSTPHLNSSESFNNYKAYLKDDVQEVELIRDVILVAQGIESKLMRFDPKTESYRIPDNVRVSPHKKKICCSLAESGWLYNKIKQYVDQKKLDNTFGPIGLSFCVALQSELRSYLRLIAVLDTQLTEHGSDITGGLTLTRLALWFKEPIKNLKLVASLVDIAKGKKGGALLSIIHSYSWHGAIAHTSLVSNMLSLTVKPLFGIISRWIYTGTLEDPYNEFFVASDPQVKDDNLWHFKYSLRKSMIPSFLSADMARKIMLTGKSVVFIHRVCHDNTQLERRENVERARLTEGSAMFSQNEEDSFTNMIDVVYKETSKHLMEVLYTKYNFINHLKAMRRYLLLGQGDFIQQLMDLLVTELSKDASALYLHNLNGILETAIRSTNAQFEDKDILSRLDVRLLEISPGDLGWDVFSLDYRTRGPISTVFTSDTVIFYLRIFNFLWRAKRMEYALANLWRQKQQYSRMLRGMTELDDLLHSAHIIASEMIHFTQQIGYFINFEVIECAWDDLLHKVNQAEDLDHIIAAHQQFLDSIMTRCLMDEEHRPMFSQLRTIFDLIIKYQQILEGFLEKASRENEYRVEYMRNAARRDSQSEWATTEEREAAEKERRTEFIQLTLKQTRSQLKVLAQTYQGMVTKFLVMLATQTDDKLQALRFRLDFNEYYQQKEPFLASPQVLKKSKPPTASLLPGDTVMQPVGGLIGLLGGRVPDNTM